MSEQKSVQKIIEQKLAAAFPGADIIVNDDSEKHAGHAGARPGGQTHFGVSICSHVFDGQSRVARQRAVLKCLSDELDGPVHALAIKATTPDKV